jgi:hypothetical protein
LPGDFSEAKPNTFSQKKNWNSTHFFNKTRRHDSANHNTSITPASPFSIVFYTTIQYSYQKLIPFFDKEKTIMNPPIHNHFSCVVSFLFQFFHQKRCDFFFSVKSTIVFIDISLAFDWCIRFLQSDIFVDKFLFFFSSKKIK